MHDIRLPGMVADHFADIRRASHDRQAVKHAEHNVLKPVVVFQLADCQPDVPSIIDIKMLGVRPCINVKLPGDRFCLIDKGGIASEHVFNEPAFNQLRG